MDFAASFTNKKKRHNPKGYKAPCERNNSNYRKELYHDPKHPERKLKKQLYYLKKKFPSLSYQELMAIIELKKNPPVHKLLKSKIYQNWFKSFASNKNRVFNERGSKVCFNWKKQKWEKRFPQDMMGVANMIIKLGIENTYKDWKLGCIDIDCRGYTQLFKARYISNRIGSAHFYFLYREDDVGNKKVQIQNFKADFKTNGYMVSPLSLHPSGSVYQIKSRGNFYVDKFEKASEALTHLYTKVEVFHFARQWKMEQMKNQIEANCYYEKR